MKAPIRILIVAGFCMAALVALVVRETLARNSGTEILLAMEAVDPRALLQGHYVIIDLRERLAPSEMCPATEAGAGGDRSNAGWVALIPDGATHHVGGGANLREAAARYGPLLVRGGFSCEAPIADAVGVPGSPGWVQLNIGIKRFYVDQARAERIDRTLREQSAGEPSRVLAIVSIGADSRARLRGLMVDGERLELDWR